MRFFNEGEQRNADNARMESEQAVRCSADRVETAHGRWPEIASEGSWHTLRLQKNHFAEDFRNLLEGKV